MSQTCESTLSGTLSDIMTDVDQFISDSNLKQIVNLMVATSTDGLYEHLEGETPEDYKLPVEEDYKNFDLQVFHEIIPEAVPQFLKFPPEEPSNLRNDEYPGPYNFEVCIIPDGQKTPWEYSVKLNKIFILMGVKFPVAFSVQNRPVDIDLFIRATPVFSQSQFFQELVYRCINHQQILDKANKDYPPHVLQHIIRCTNRDTQYMGDKEKQRRLSLVLPLSAPPPGTDSIKEFFQFVCKNSCPEPMNRRTIEVIFSLETESGEVVGRRVVSVRICSCPKRDKDKEEKEVNKNPTCGGGKKRKVKTNSNTSGGKRLTAVGTESEQHHQLTISGKKHCQKLLELGQMYMSSEMVNCVENGQSDAQFRKSRSEINSLLQKCQNESRDDLAFNCKIT